MAEILHVDDLKASAHNCLDFIKMKKGYTLFLRFTSNQLELYKDDILFENMSLCSSGIYLSLCTRGNKLSFYCRPFSVLRNFAPTLKKLHKADFKKLQKDLAKQIKERAIMPTSFTFDLEINEDQIISKKCQKGKITFYFKNKNHSNMKLKLYFPVFPYAAVKNFRSNHSLHIAPISNKTMFCLGDSITQGFNTVQITDSYVIKLANRLGYDALNQGIGGFWFDSRALEGLESLDKPELITIAYGTNDWQHFDKYETIEKNVELYFKTLNSKFPETPVFVITPIWRADIDKDTKAGSFMAITMLIEGKAKKYSNFKVIRGIDIPIHNRHYFRDNYLHPNKEGFTIMAAYLGENIRKTLSNQQN
ncbi:MAG: SGNH/GDSL hydrolase family protein [Sphaerochaetaceae bacterium]|nr:SGNH/GDSL hydrolase family protein [Sphaerochaetaceae bacterium]